MTSKFGHQASGSGSRCRAVARLVTSRRGGPTSVTVPREETNRAETETARTAELSRDVDGLSRLASSQARSSQIAEIGLEECERLKALGYVDDCGS